MMNGGVLALGHKTALHLIPNISDIFPYSGAHYASETPVIPVRHAKYYSYGKQVMLPGRCYRYKKGKINPAVASIR